jgi:hypothetical protein
MVRAFNTAGPCRPEKHYMIPPLGRLPEAGSAQIPGAPRRPLWFNLFDEAGDVRA